MINIYGKKRFSPEEAKDHVESLVSDFKDHYDSLGYTEVPSVKITSGIDPTVRFIGSHISVFKPYLDEDRVPSSGVYTRQDCLRTRNVEKLLDDSYFPNWGSYFSSIGGIVCAGKIKRSMQ
jgi:alanyl-tRNA synthetase